MAGMTPTQAPPVDASAAYTNNVPTANPATVGQIPSVNAPQLFGTGPQQAAPPQVGGAQIMPGGQPFAGMTYAQWLQMQGQTPSVQNGGVAAPGATGQGSVWDPNVGWTTGGASAGGGIPQVSAQNISGIPNVNAQQIMAPNSIVGQMGGPAAYSADASTAAIRNALLPQFDQQNKALQESLASSGIVGGTTGKAMADLGSQQQTTLANDVQPYILARQQMQQAGTTQDVGNQMQQQIANQVADLQAQGMNQSSAQQIAIQNAANQLQAGGMNAQMAYQVASQNAQLSQQAQLANQATATQAGEFNAGTTNAANQFNIQNFLQSQTGNNASYNNMLQYIMGLQNQDWLAQLGATSNTATAGLGATTNAFQPNYQQPGPVNLSGIAGAFAPNASSGGAAAPPPGMTPGAFNAWSQNIPPPSGG